jgi:predicted phosphoribosyltransferase
MSDFANLQDGGRALAPLVAAAVASAPDPVLLAVIPNGVPVALAVSEATGLPVLALEAERSDAGVTIVADPRLSGRDVLVVDDGVETGTVARAAAPALRASGVASLALAVPVCPTEAADALQDVYDVVIAAVRPLVRRDLDWHYADFDTIDAAHAHALLAERPA